MPNLKNLTIFHFSSFCSTSRLTCFLLNCKNYNIKAITTFKKKAKPETRVFSALSLSPRSVIQKISVCFAPPRFRASPHSSLSGSSLRLLNFSLAVFLKPCGECPLFARASRRATSRRWEDSKHTTPERSKFASAQSENSVGTSEPGSWRMSNAVRSPHLCTLSAGVSTLERGMQLFSLFGSSAVERFGGQSTKKICNTTKLPELTSPDGTASFRVEPALLKKFPNIMHRSGSLYAKTGTFDSMVNCSKKNA